MEQTSSAFSTGVPASAAIPQLAGNSRQGFGPVDGTMHWASGWVISSNTLGIKGSLYDGDAGSRSTGKERDAESGNDYFGARYYSSAMGRFMSPDWSAKVEPVPYSKLDDPQSLNLYAYVRNNPILGVDADGHEGFHFCSVSSTQMCGDGTPDPPSPPPPPPPPPAQQQSGVPANIVVNQTAQQNLNGTPLQYPGDNSAVKLPTTPLYGFGIGLTYGVTDSQGNAVPTKNLTMEESVVLKSATPPEASVVASGLSQTKGTIPFAVNGRAYDQVGPMSSQKGITEKLAGFPSFSLTLQQTLTVHGPGDHSFSTTRLITLTNSTITDTAP